VYISINTISRKKKEKVMKDIKDTGKSFKVSEVWSQDLENSDLWHGKHGVIVNTAALNEREFYFDIIRLTAQPVNYKERYTRTYA
jgi:hypothetical protein